MSLLFFLKNIGNNSAAEVIAERICGGIEYKIETRLNISCSIGIAMYPSCGDCYEDLYRFADKALYCAKDQGKNRWCFSSGNVG